MIAIQMHFFRDLYAKMRASDVLSARETRVSYVVQSIDLIKSV